jgi:hypothetical protein
MLSRTVIEDSGSVNVPLELSESDATIWSITNSRVIIYDFNMFIIHAKGGVKSWDLDFVEV